MLLGVIFHLTQLVLYLLGRYLFSGNVVGSGVFFGLVINYVGDGFICSVCVIVLLEESDIGEALMGMVFLDGYLGFGEMYFECSPCLVGGILVIPLYDLTYKDVGIGNVD